jgi:hypothetical protein
VGAEQRLLIIDSFAVCSLSSKRTECPVFLWRTVARSIATPCGENVFDPEADDITASKLAVDGEIEHRQVSNVTFDVELGPYRPDIIGSKRGLRTNQFSPMGSEVNSRGRP